MCVRHGRTAWNAGGRFQGRSDVPLDDEGRVQAQALAAYLGGERFDIAIASDLRRATATAAAIASVCGARIEPESRLREMGFGTWEGLTWEEIMRQTPGLTAEDRSVPSAYVPAGGESLEDVSERIRPVLAELCARLPPNGRALIVSHAGVMHALLRVALDEPNEAALGITFLPASIMRLTGDGSIPWRLVGFNEIAPPLVRPAGAAG